MSIVRARYGNFRIIDSDRAISQSLKEYGEWAQNEVDFLLHFIRPGDVVGDVGAFIGTHSRAFSDAVGPSGIVYAFEPRDRIAEILSENAGISTIRNIKVFNCGLGREHKEAGITGSLAGREDNFGGFALINVDATLDNRGDSMRLCTLDEFGFTRLDFLKIDVEGMEIDVLLGGSTTIAGCRPIIFAEVNSLTGGAPLLQWCSKHQYAMFCAIHQAFNPKNFFGNAKNRFAYAVEVGALLVPDEKVAEYADWIRGQRLLPIVCLDDLVLALLHKPQYVIEVLEKSASASVLDVDFRRLRRGIRKVFHKRRKSLKLWNVVKRAANSLMRNMKEIK